MEKLEFFKRKTISIYIVRHPEVENALLKVFNGSLDVDLSKNGLVQAKKLKEFFKDKEIKKIFSSPLKRCIKTASIIQEAINCELIVNNRLKERNFGIFESLSWQEIEKNYPIEASSFLKDPFNFKIKNGESFSDVYNRVKSFLEEFDFSEHTLIVAHGGVNRVMIKHFMDLKNEKILSISQDFACINHFLTDGNFFLTKLINGVL
ncbi:Alpha-ribazole-5'-phosphate phosphatase [Desulfurella amilsii]|uniref:Alpha-ribazole phosphatase n=1 Tax=Desulfurella amilsii TaxID=1562698 RepID=A0A1X4XVC7_9BACT|nr:alpha-ribazole phosphatase [Desulfurella amilsii]OSS41487.1 Alpha-ribazole-5'-phosphate phosphatase [Desulfurella amilsii]